MALWIAQVVPFELNGPPLQSLTGQTPTILDGKMISTCFSWKNNLAKIRFDVVGAKSEGEGEVKPSEKQYPLREFNLLNEDNIGFYGQFKQWKTAPSSQFLQSCRARTTVRISMFPTS